MRRILMASLLAGILLSTSCATIIHNDRTNRPKSERGEFDWGATVLGNLVLMGLAAPIGIFIDMGTGAAWKDRRPGEISTAGDFGDAVQTESDAERKWRKAKKY